MTTEEFGWFGQTLNECCAGFGVKDFKGTIGVDQEIVERLLDQIRPMYHATVGYLSTEPPDTPPASRMIPGQRYVDDLLRKP
ncbi:MAG TPA: hypothetical protein VNF99_09365 [Stellaceae bacterium]|nr:hypothetical protein [Stellaceae bacterium]